MSPNELSGPDLDGVVADANAVGLPYVLRGGLPPLDYETVAARVQDRLDLEALERVTGELPIDPIPGLDT